jgi:hypothetical protein
MRRPSAFAVAAAVLLSGAAALGQAVAVYKVPFPFKIEAKNPIAGAYTVAGIKDHQITLKQEATGREYAVPFTEILTPPEGAPAGARLVFDEVGDFAPSYTEYITVYVLSEVWPSAAEGYRVHTTKGSHKTKVITAEAAK